MAVLMRILRVGVFRFAVAYLFLALAAPGPAAGQPCAAGHPLAPPDSRFAGQCPNCGMPRAMWARTWTSFSNAEGSYSVCSVHCLADISRKSGRVPQQIQVALYLSPEVAIPAQDAFFVVGSRARGTMTEVSKLAFADRGSAEAFAAACGGRVTTWMAVYGTALAAVGAENRAVDGMRMKNGKIIDPRDRVDECAVCGMYPARYGRNRAQVKTLAGKTVHLCSTQCLFKYLEDPRRYAGAGAGARMAWVTGYESRRWISAETAYYVLGSGKRGPMGYEAFAFDTRPAAESFRVENGGKILPFSQVTIEGIFSSQ